MVYPKPIISYALLFFCKCDGTQGFSGAYYCVLAETLLPPCTIFFFLLKLLPWSSLWKLTGVLLSCHTPNIGHVMWFHLYTENLSKFTCLAVNLTSLPKSVRVFCTRHFKLHVLSLTEMKCGEDNSAYHLAVTERCAWFLCHTG